MTAVHPLFTAPAASVGAAMVRSFLALEIPESFTVDYKRGVADVDDTAAAMANAYGGVVIAGVDVKGPGADKNLPGEVCGVKSADKDTIVNKMASTYDPPWWAPEIIPVTMDDGKVVVVVRVDAGSAPRPVIYKGKIRNRLDGQDTNADRRLIQMLFTESTYPELSPTDTPRHYPSMHHLPPETGYKFNPEMVIRAAMTVSLLSAVGRKRLSGTVIESIVRAFSAGPAAPDRLNSELESLYPHGGGDLPFVGFRLARSPGSSRLVRLCAGNDTPEGHEFTGGGTSMRMECTVQLQHDRLVLFFDVVLWRGGHLMTGESLVEMCYQPVRALADDVAPAVVEELLGNAILPSGPMELHISLAREVLGTDVDVQLEEVVDIGFLGERSGEETARGGSEFLDPDLVAAGQLREAVRDALAGIVLEWRYLHPAIPE